MKTFHAFCENAYSIDKRPCPSGYKWTKKYIACTPKSSRWKTYGARWGGVGYRDEYEETVENDLYARRDVDGYSKNLFSKTNKVGKCPFSSLF